MSEERTIEIETKLAYQEDYIQKLNNVIISMQKQIKKLELSCKNLNDKVSSIEKILPAETNVDEIPPHY